MAFWHLSPARLVVAVIEPTVAEPLLHACASSSGALVPGGGRFAAGILEAARAAGAMELRHAVYLGEPSCRLVAEPDAAATDRDERGAVGGDGESAVEVRLHGGEQGMVLADPAAVAEAAGLFAAARLRLVWLDCAGCALATLSEFLGCPQTQAAEGLPPAEPDPLAAVSVARHCEDTAVFLGCDLAVPVGGALERFGAANDGFG